MNAHGRLAQPIRAKVDSQGRLVSADAPIARLHRRAGGQEEGPLALPQLAELARLTMRLGIPLSRPVRVADEESDIDLWVETRCEEDGVALRVVDWNEQDAEHRTDLEAAARGHRPASLPGIAEIQLDSALRVLRLRGFPDAEALAGKPLTRMFALDDGDEENGHVLLEAVAERQPFRRQAAKLRRDDSEWLLSGQPLFDRNGNFAGYLCEAERKRADAGEDGEEANGEQYVGTDILTRNEFGERLAPALRQPLGRIIANADTIGSQLSGPLRANYARYAQDIASAGRHLMALVDDLTDLEIVERESFQAAKDIIELGDVARRAAGLLAVKASDHHIRIETPEEEASQQAVGEFRRVLQVLVNLLQNAIRYSPDGSTVRMTIGREDDTALLTVTDEGPGIDPRDQEKIFGKFERLGRSGDGGSGLGLYISRRLARAMGGDLRVESRPGEGARFILELPVNE